MTQLRAFEPGDVEFALAQKVREGWAVNRQRFEVYPVHDPDGCFIAVDDGRPVGMVTTTWFGQSGWIGNLIVDPDCRGRGIGRALMEHGLDRLRSRGAATVRLEGDPPGIPLYRSLGFVDEFESRRLALAGPSARRTPREPGVETMSDRHLDEVAALAAEIFGADRRRFLELVLACTEIAVVRRRGGGIVGSLMAVPTDRGLRVGPCVARSPSDVRPLVAEAVSASAGRQVLIGVPSPNTEALGMLGAMGFEERPSSMRMRLGPAIAVGDPAGVFAISSGAAG